MARERDSCLAEGANAGELNIREEGVDEEGEEGGKCDPGEGEAEMRDEEVKPKLVEKQHDHCVHQQWPGHSFNFEVFLNSHRLHLEYQPREHDPRIVTHQGGDRGFDST